MFDHLYEFGWKPIKENDKVIGLSKEDKNITLEPGNQIELSGAKLSNIHEAVINNKADLKLITEVKKMTNNPSSRI